MTKSNLSALPSALALLTFALMSAFVSAVPQLAAYSSSGHFACALGNGQRCDTLTSNAVVQSSLLPNLLHYLMTSDKNNVADHTLATAVVSSSSSSLPPTSMTILVHSMTSVSDPSSLISRAAHAIPSDTATAFRVASDQVVHAPVLNHESARFMTSAAELQAVAMDHSSQLPSLVALPASSQAEVDQIFNSLYVIAQRTNNNVAIVFSLRQQEDEQKEVDANDATSADAAGVNGTTVSDSDMLPPDITAPQLAGLMVGFMFLAIFIPGFLCLWRIQTPQTFAILDSSDMKKKLQ